MQPCVLTDFKVHFPRFEISQAEAADWVWEAHTRAEAVQQALAPRGENPVLQKRKLFDRYFVKPDRIQTRWVDVPDAISPQFEDHDFFNDKIGDRTIRERTDFFSERAFEVFQAFYPSSAQAPQHLIHVSCTGYSAPSAAQRLVALRNWVDYPQVTHAYHMGCYAALSSIRLAEGLVQSLERVDLVHTEICTIHMNPLLHDPEQIVIQSLFADGYIRYSAVPESFSRAMGKRGFRILGHAERIIPDSASLMTWVTEPWGMGMTLSPQVPQLIVKHLPGFVETLLQNNRLSWHDVNRAAIFAVHPGGPKIIDEVQKILELQDWQVDASREVLRRRGNMSSATLPHIWNELLKSEITLGTRVVSLAFGPGLSILGAVFEAV